MSITATVLRFLERQDKGIIEIVGLILIAVIGLIDFATGYEIGTSVFYVLPISLVTWIVGLRQGIAASIASALAWLVADVATRQYYSHALVPVWNTAIRLTFFIIITILLSALRRAMQRESELAQIDPLTGASNRRFFGQLAQSEIDRCQRYHHAFTLAYIDLDNFKKINDLKGHSVGDRVLCDVVALINDHIRKTDRLARLGGDEFALLLPETNGASAQKVLAKIHSQLDQAMKDQGWPITFSIGALTCVVAPPSTDVLIALADELMYSVKNNGKNSMSYGTYSGP